MTLTHDTAHTSDWRHRAQCQEEDPELFFPFGPSGTVTNQTSQAKEVCARCPVRAECLTWALETGQDCGVWGGLDEDELRNIRLQAARRSRRQRTAAGKNTSTGRATDNGQRTSRNKTPTVSATS